MEKLPPDIGVFNSNVNPVLCSPNTPFVLGFYQTQETLQDVELYKRFLNNAISRFRHSRTYKSIKSDLMSLGMDKCQVHGNIVDGEMATVEMHHCILTIFDIALMITEHTLRTKGMISSFDLVLALQQEHKEHNVPLTMLSKTPHQLYHNTDELFIAPSMVFGNWYRLLEKYKYGITKEIAFKIIFYLNKAIETCNLTEDNDILSLREKIQKWSIE